MKQKRNSHQKTEDLRNKHKLRSLTTAVTFAALASLLGLVGTGCKTSGSRNRVAEAPGADGAFPNCFDTRPDALKAQFGDTQATCKVAPLTAMRSLYEAIGRDYSLKNKGATPNCDAVQGYLRNPASSVFIDLSGKGLDCAATATLRHLNTFSTLNLIGLDMSYNNISGMFIPWTIAPQLENTLIYIDLSHNNIAGSVNDILGSSNLNLRLRVVDISDNQIVDHMSLRNNPNLASFQSAWYLDVSKNMIGEVGTSDAATPLSLAYLDVGSQKFSGVGGKLSVYANRGPNGQFLPLFDLAHLGADNTNINQTTAATTGIGDFGGYGRTDSLSLRRLPTAPNQPGPNVTVTGGSISATASMVDYRGWSSNIFVTPYQFSGAGSASSAPFEGVWRDNCEGSKSQCSTSDDLPLGGCPFYKRMLSLKSQVTAQDLADGSGLSMDEFSAQFDQSLAKYAKYCRI